MGNVKRTRDDKLNVFISMKICFSWRSMLGFSMMVLVVLVLYDAHSSYLTMAKADERPENINIMIWYAFAIYFVIRVIHHVAGILILIIKLIPF